VPCARLSMLAFAMPAGFTRSEVEAIAALARLELDNSELDLFARQLGDILEYANQVQRIDTTGVAPTASVAARHAADRPDVVTPSLERAAALVNAPDSAPGAGLFKVPRVIG
jgi:aspartyl-tRNA(Asn)/glutamyl-tRNA(Gln) amidotransferase subunit C